MILKIISIRFEISSDSKLTKNIQVSKCLLVYKLFHVILETLLIHNVKNYYFMKCL